MTSKLYTVIDRNGTVIGESLTAVEAMHEILTDDGHEYEIRPEEDGEGHRLWTSTYSRNGTAWNGISKSVVFSLEGDAERAEQEIAERVIAADWPRKPSAITDEQQAELVLAADKDEILGARSNDIDALLGGIKHIYNCAEVDVDDEGDVWIATPQRGHWLDANGLARIARALRAGDL